MPNNLLEKVIYISNEDYETLVSAGTVTIGGKTLTYDENIVYITPEKAATIAEDGLMSAEDKVKLDTITGITNTVTSGSTDVVTSSAVYTAINNLPKPMIYKGTLGTGGTITELPSASNENEGFTYKVITAGTYASQSAKVGDVFISNGSTWTLVPAGDDVEDTWRQINVNGTQLKGTGISTGAVNFKNGSNVTITGSGNDITISASQPTVNNGTLTIQKNGANVQTFTANQSSNVTANITVPTKVTDLSDASQYAKNGDILVPTSGYSYIYNGQLDDAFWSAAKRYYITCSIHPITVDGVTYPHVDSTKTIADDDYIVDSTPATTYNSIDEPSLNKLFDGSPDTHFIQTSGDNYIKIRIIPLATRQDDYSPAASTISFSGYPYGWFAVSTYWGAEAARVQYATYNKHSSWPTGWDIVEGTKVNNDQTWRINDINNYTRTVMDFWFIGDGNSSHILRPTAIYWIKNRVTNIDDENSYFSKYVDETLTTDVAWKCHGTRTAKIAAATGTGEFKTIYENGTSLADKYLGKTAKAADSAKLNGQDASYYLTSIKMNGTTKTSTNSIVDLGTVITSHQSLSGYMKVVSNSNGVMTITY